MDIRREILPAQPYLYVDGDCALDGAAIAQAMTDAFARMFAHKERTGLEPLGPPIAVYTEMPADRLRFRCGLRVSPADTRLAQDRIHAATLPEGDAMSLTHVGPYSALNQSHNLLWTHMKDAGIPAAMPVWEVYVDDPATTPEHELRTIIYRSVGA